MNPVAFEIFGVKIYWYGVIIATGVVIATMIAMKAAARKGIREEDILDLLLVGLPISLLGARAYYVIFNWDYYRGDFFKIINIRGGGLAIHGGIIAAVITAVIFSKIRGINFWVLADVASPSLILGQAIGRWGNYANGEAHGGPTDLPWGIIVDGVKVHPTFLYESVWNFLVFIFLVWYSRNKAKFDGEIFLLYLILYSVARFFIEGMRTDSLMIGNIKMAQLISVVIIIAALLIYLRRNSKKN